jgi:hypothetical protein
VGNQVSVVGTKVGEFEGANEGLHGKEKKNGT